MNLRKVAAITLVVAAANASAQVPSVPSNNSRTNDSGVVARPYGLRNPVPHALLRDLSPGETAFTVDVGHIQIEMDMVSFTDDHRNGARTHSIGIGATTFKVGVRPNIDLHIATQFVSIDREALARSQVTGVGDFTASLKINAWGNDGGTTAFAVMPYVTVPAGPISFRGSEGGVILPFAVAVAGGFAVDLVPQFDVVHAVSGRGYEVSAAQTVTIGHDIVGPVAATVEAVIGRALRSHAPVTATGDAAVTFAFSPNLQFELGANVGLTRSTERLSAFIGITKRY